MYKIIGFSFLLGLSFVLSSCASHNQMSRSPAGQSDLAKDSLDRTKTPARIQKRTEVIGPAMMPYFAKIQILSEVVAIQGCSGAESLNTVVDEDPVAQLSQDNEIQFLGSKPTSLDSVFLVQLSSLGFDQTKYQVSLVNGKSVSPLPYSVSLQALPNNEVELRYLDQSVRLQLNTTPVYTFSAEETRGDCVLQHNINVFGESAGRYSLR